MLGCIIIFLGVGLAIVIVGFTVLAFQELRDKVLHVGRINDKLFVENRNLEKQLQELTKKYSWDCPTCTNPTQLVKDANCVMCHGTKKMWIDSAENIQKTMSVLPAGWRFNNAITLLSGVLYGSNKGFEGYLYNRQVQKYNEVLKHPKGKKKRSKKS